jgi:hypothetical protein
LLAGGKRFAVGCRIEPRAQFGGLSAGFVQFHVTGTDSAQELALQVVQGDSEHGEFEMADGEGHV